MRLLLTILLFPIFCNAQFSAGVANYTSENAIKFGVLVNSSTLSNSEKADISKDTLGCNWVRSALTVADWDGSSSRYEIYRDKGVKQLVVINYTNGNPSPFVPASQLSGYADTIELMLDEYPDMYGIVIENEAINTTFHTGALSDYIAMIQTAYSVAHPRGVKVTDGGFYGVGLDIKVYRWLVTKYGQSAADQYGALSMTNAQINAAQTPNSNPTMEAKAKQIDTIFQAVNYVDYFNIHPYEVFSQTNLQPDTVTQISPNVLRYQKEYVEETTRKPCISNETGVRVNTQPLLVGNLIAEYYRLGFFHMQYFDGVGGLAGAEPITDETTGVLLPNGVPFKNFVITHQQNGSAGLP